MDTELRITCIVTATVLEESLKVAVQHVLRRRRRRWRSRITEIILIFYVHSPSAP